jgi:glucose-6-phosphate 1-dehydrogenase
MTPEALSEQFAAANAAPIATKPATIVVFGGAGDLAHRKLIPALFNLFLDGVLPSRFAVVGTGRQTFDDESYRNDMREGVQRFSRRKPDEDRWRTFAESLFFVSLDIENPQAFATLGARLDTIEHERNIPGNRVYYLAVPPSLIVPTVESLSRSRFVAPPEAKTFARLIVEKPIGHDLASAMAINDAIARVFDERQIYRIDHYLGKETVQNILVMRFANSLFEPLFNQKYIDHVQITVSEEEGVGTRAGYYEQAGALRDMVQNHLIQLLALTAMEPPHALNADVVRQEKLELVQSIRPIEGDAMDSQVVRAQYGPGTIDGKPVPGYTSEQGVDPHSQTETYVALQASIDNWRWAGVPFFLRTGRRLPKRVSEISIQLKDVPAILFNKNPAQRLEPNVLSIRIQPDEGFALGIISKVPGARVRVQPVSMDFQYCEAFGVSSPEAYERLLLDVLVGDPTLFMLRATVEASWRWLMPILDHWKAQPVAKLPTYTAGQSGPPEADRLIEGTGRRWRQL